MPKWLHRTSKQLLRSVPAAELPEPRANYIEEPDLLAVQGQPNRYWKIAGDVVSLMAQPERDVVDAAIRQAQIDEELTEFDQPGDIEGTAILALLDEINADRPANKQITLTEFKARVRTKRESQI